MLTSCESELLRRATNRVLVQVVHQPLRHGQRGPASMKVIAVLSDSLQLYRMFCTRGGSSRGCYGGKSEEADITDETMKHRRLYASHGTMELYIGKNSTAG